MILVVFRFGKSNAGYVSWVIIGILGTEVMTGWVTDTLWTSLNYGKTYESVDWSKFKSADEEEEEEEGMYSNETFYRRKIQVDIIISRCSDLNTYTIVPLQKKKQKRKQRRIQKRMKQTMMRRRKSRLIDELK